MGLYDMMMIKDNHVTAAGGIPEAIARAEAFIAQKVGVLAGLWRDFLIPEAIARAEAYIAQKVGVLACLWRDCVLIPKAIARAEAYIAQKVGVSAGLAWLCSHLYGLCSLDTTFSL